MRELAAVLPLAQDDEPNTFLVLAMFAIGGILIGGAWSARHERRTLAIILAIVGVIAVAAGILQQIPG